MNPFNRPCSLTFVMLAEAVRLCHNPTYAQAVKSIEGKHLLTCKCLPIPLYVIFVTIAGIAWPRNPGHGAAGWIIEEAIKNETKEFSGAVYLSANTTDTMAEYAALIQALRRIIRGDFDLKTKVTVNTDNLMIVRHMNGRWKVKYGFHLVHKEAANLSKLLKEIEYIHVPKEATARAKVLAEQLLKDRGVGPGFQG